MSIITAMTEIGNQAGNGIWPSLPDASRWFDRASIVLALALLLSFAATVVLIWLGIVKEHHWDLAREEAQARIAQLDNETARLHAQDALTTESLLATVRAGRANALANEANRSTTEAIAVAQGLMKREAASEATRALYIVSKVAPFAGKKFDAVVTTTAIDMGMLLGALRNALKIAGWIEIEQSDPTAGVGLLLMDKTGGPALVRIDVDASKDSELLDAAETLASALNAEGVAATVNSKTETTNAAVIHILVGPKP
jgi:hypothetical protein